MIRVLFVCLGNICRSPTAEGAFRALVAREGLNGKIEIDSAGTGDWHIGEPPDERAVKAARARGTDISGLRARQATAGDFKRFDYILAMDAENHKALAAVCPPGEEYRLRYFLDFAPEAGRRDVPDPYFGGRDGFDDVLDLVEIANRRLLDHIRREHAL